MLWLSLLDPGARSAISSSATGVSFDYLGCFPLGFTVSMKQFDDVVQTQRRMKDLSLLCPVKQDRLQKIGESLRQFCDSFGGQGQPQGLESIDWLAAVQELADQLCNSLDSQPSIQVHIGLDSGFRIHSETRFWAVYQHVEDEVLDVYVSRNATDVAGAILHTFLSSRGCPRHDCFHIEILFAKFSTALTGPSRLPERILDDFALLSPAELLTFLQTLALSSTTKEAYLVDLFRSACEAQLLDSVDFLQLKELSTVAYLSGRASAKDLVIARTSWYRQIGAPCPDASMALDNFLQVDTSITAMLKQRDISKLNDLTESLANCLSSAEIDSQADLLTLSIFCAMRKHAFDEAYMEVTDRNTLFNDQSDQAAAFAELFATGARCEAYFDVTPSALGKLLSDRYRAYHHEDGHEPPLWTDASPATPSAYAAAKIDVDPSFTKAKMSSAQQFTFLSVFAIPALLDILLLTSTVRTSRFLSA